MSDLAEISKDKSFITDMLVELSSPIRYLILSKLDEKDSKQSKLASELEMTMPESHRQFERLSSVGLIAKRVDGLYTLTPFGKAIFLQLKSIGFFIKLRGYFTSHTIGDLPLKFVKRISDLENCDLVEGAFVINERMKQIASTGKYLKVISAHVPLDAFRAGLASAKRSQKQVSIIYGKNTLIPKGFKKEFMGDDVQALMSKGTYGRRTLDTKVQIYLVLNDKTALILFPDLKGDADLNCGLHSTDSVFHEWCIDYHNYVWDKAGQFRISDLKES